MCIIIDTCALSRVFSKDDNKHKEFAPVLRWIIGGPGFVVYGGSKYFEELGRASHYLSLLTELRRSGRAKVVDRHAVDSEQAIVEELVPPSCNDSHIIAIVRASGCRLICTDERR